MTVSKKITVLGAGNGGCAFSGHLAHKGFDVSLFEHPKFEKNLEEIKEKGGIELTGKIEGFGKLSNITTNIADALREAKIIMVAVPAFAHFDFMEMAMPYLEDGQIIVFNPDNYASLRLKKLLKENNIEKKIYIAGTSSLLYATRKATPSKVNIFEIKSIMPVGVLPSVDTEYVLKNLKELFDEFIPAENILEVDLQNGNMLVHCPGMVLNAGRIESTKGDFMFYWEGMTESVCRVIEEVDRERMRVGEKLGLKLQDFLTEMRKFYNKEKPGKDLHDFLTHSRAHGGRGPDSPKDLKHRYLSEDVPFGLVAVSELGKLVDVSTPATDSIIILSSVLNQEDYMKSGITIEKIGFLNKALSEIQNYLKAGK